MRNEPRAPRTPPLTTVTRLFEPGDETRQHGVQLGFWSGDVELYGRLRMTTPVGPTIMLLPGLGFHTFEYEPLAAWLADRGYNALSIDYRGHGHSGGTRGSWTLVDLVADTRCAVGVATDRCNSPVALFETASARWSRSWLAPPTPGSMPLSPPTRPTASATSCCQAPADPVQARQACRSRGAAANQRWALLRL